MIYDPDDINICMNSKGVLFYRNPNAGPNQVEWVELHQLPKDWGVRPSEW